MREHHDAAGWFWLSDGHYWPNLGEVNFYEVTEAAYREAGDTGSRFVDYQLARLVEDFSAIFYRLAEPIPDDFYALVKDPDELSEFWNAASRIVGDLVEDEHEHGSNHEAAIYRADRLCEWLRKRTLSALQLIGSPGISFFRNRDKISLVWLADATLESGTRLWSAGKGSVEMDYDHFVAEVADFQARLFQAMEAQIHTANAIDEQGTPALKAQRLSEHEQRKGWFEDAMRFLWETEKPAPTDWNDLREIRRELGI